MPDRLFKNVGNRFFSWVSIFLVKQLKNRYNDLTVHRRFVVGIDRTKMRLYDVDQSAQENVSSEYDAPAFDNTNIGKRDFSQINV